MRSTRTALSGISRDGCGEAKRHPLRVRTCSEKAHIGRRALQYVHRRRRSENRLGVDALDHRAYFEPSIDESEEPYRTLVTYKETHANAKIDLMLDVWTGTWRDSRPFNPEGPQPENALTGTIFTVNAWRNDPIIVPAEYAQLRFWRNTDVARLEPGERTVLLKGLLGHEWDEDLDNGFRPPGLFRLSETTIDNVPYVQDCGSVFDSGTATHHLTLYRDASGALVFGAGTVQWAWGLDAHHDTETGVPPERVNENTTRVGVDPSGPDRNVRQATVNLFADMGVRPATLPPDLVRAEASDDRKPPVSRIDEPRTGSSLPPGPVQVSGASHDRGGGCVAAVEVSVDGGAAWHPVEGREAWRYEWKPEGSGTRTIVCRAVDDSGNLEAPAAGVTVTVSEEVLFVTFSRWNPTAFDRTIPWTDCLGVRQANWCQCSR